jgi:hypothetical protein
MALKYRKNIMSLKLYKILIDMSKQAMFEILKKMKYQKQTLP